MKSTNPLARLLGRSPFTPIQEHMRIVDECVKQLPRLFEALLADDREKVAEIAMTIDQLESKADKAKNDYRFRMPATLWMPVGRRDLLMLISEQDGIADAAEDIAKLLVSRPMAIPDELKGQLTELAQNSVDTCAEAVKIVEELDELLEVGFGGKESAKVIEMIAKLRSAEGANDMVIARMKRSLYEIEDRLKPVDVMFLYKLIDYLGRIANRAENSGDRVLLLIAK